MMVGFVRLLLSDASHFLLPTDLGDEASAWLLSQGIQHDAHDFYVMGRGVTGGTVISIQDDFGAFAFRMWGDDTVIGPIEFPVAPGSNAPSDMP